MTADTVGRCLSHLADGLFQKLTGTEDAAEWSAAAILQA